VLFYRQEDLGLRRFFAAGGGPDTETLREVGEAVAEGEGPVDAAEVREATGLSERALTRAVNALEDADAVRRLPHEQLEVTDPGALEEAAAQVAHTQHVQQQVEASRLEMMRQYAESRACRRAFLLSYFGEVYEPPCGNCDNDTDGTAAGAGADVPFALDTRVRHRLWGEGLVLRYEGPAMTVLFDEVGYKSLSVEVVQSQQLLEPVT
jgi:ATP-dependent DNA helicase RecQ